MMTELPAATLAVSAALALALAPALALGVGLLLGAVFFGGLWWTVQRGLHSRYAALWFSLSMLLRTGVTLLGFVLVAHGSWSRLAICLAGFAVARLIVTRLTSLAPPAPSPMPSPMSSPMPSPLPLPLSAPEPVAAGASHAP